MTGHESNSAARPPRPADATRTFDQLAVQQDPLLGQIVGNYHLLARAGEGAFGVVYRARDVRLDRTVAIKFLRGPVDTAARQRFEQEARAMARVGKHAGVVDLYAWGEHEGQCYLAMEYVPESAASRLARQPGGLDMAQVQRIGIACADALSAAHAASVVHGDLKPSNILLSDDGQDIKLCDFGLARIQSDDPALGGSPAYLAPECASGSPATAASDIYALGASLQTLLTGAPPVEASDSAGALAASAAGKLRPLASARPGLPAALVEVLTRAMALDPARRYPSAAEFARALQKAANPPKRQARRKALPVLRWAAAALAVLVLGSGIVLVQGLLPGVGNGSVVLADARLKLNDGDYEAARAGFEQYLSSQPDNAEARYGLAYAFLLEGEHEQAAKEFAQLGEAALREEGRAATAYMANGPAARPALEHAEEESPGGYAAVLLARLDLMDGRFDEAQQRLDGIDEDQLNFDWQRREYLKTLGQSRYKAGDYSGAEAVFARLERSGSGEPEAFASDYAALARQRSETLERKDTGEQLTRLKALREGAPESEAGDAWSSRPLRIWIPPVDARKGVVAQETGLADVLPWRLSRGLLRESSSFLTPVDRSAIADILAEQELSAVLSEPDEALRLGRVMGAKLLLQLKVTRLFDEEILYVSLVDTETTRMTPVGEYTIDRKVDVEPWLDALMQDLLATTRAAYPMRALLVPTEEGPAVSVSEASGAKAGMVFQVVEPGVAIDPDTRIVLETPGESYSKVTIEGVLPESWADGAWKVEEVAADAT
ncbi:MAG: protein kinase [Candidatus Hydrogenedens sp.]|nr:protein kinase [Candidatus Hydrogenedens sp.]